ncbi:MAG TPA: carboxypeptidase regulatory-like domain-containing protein [Gemmatimonadaceae bacterium]|nr:carboxypeptidase regulatory-like domain-containing protein [Gemmatimonadaceae bacterium]
MPSMRTIVRVVAGLLPLAATACLTDPAAPVDAGVPTGLHVVAQTSPSEGDRTVRVQVFFLNAQEQEVELPVSPAELTVPANSSVTEGVTTQLARCFEEAASSTEGGVPACPLIVRLVLLDDDGETLAEGSRSVTVQQGENPVEVPSISLIAPSIGGVVVDATTGQGVGGANVALYAGTATTGTPVATLVAGTGGAYLFPGLRPGTYTLVATLGGFFEATAGPITVESGTSTMRDIIATPVPAEGELRIVLTWGATPFDLDSHLFGPASAGSYHVYFAAESAPPYANLDVDDTDSFGPETITITQIASGAHIYGVHNYSDRFSAAGDDDPAGRTALAGSGARVRVFDSEGLRAEFTVPTGQEGTFWTVFSLDGETITPINTMTFASDPDLTPPTGTARVTRGTGAALSRMPATKRAKAPRP